MKIKAIILISIGDLYIINIEKGNPIFDLQKTSNINRY